MTLPELQRAIYQQSVEEQLFLLETLVQALKVAQQTKLERRAIVARLWGCLKKNGQPALTDHDIGPMQEERLVEKYLK
ncbi:MAG: hypothetical protein HC851_06315 [Acaryochloris sp. RU_4_1]|nr:hypothetical protein [Acaryochloris sp. RU_4_1]NJR55174.1 hypothetical protein [Acaryochloris sp. CRU_2_0]